MVRNCFFYFVPINVGILKVYFHILLKLNLIFLCLQHKFLHILHLSYINYKDYCHMYYGTTVLLTVIADWVTGHLLY